jgi:hypothetical protein
VAQDPDGADAVYETAVDVLKECTRDTSQFPLVSTENARYGFRRNMLGLRPFGLASSLLGLIVAIVAAASITASRSAFLADAVIDLLLLLVFWWKTVTRAWVRRQAEAYAEALLRTIEHLAQPQKPVRRSTPPTSCYEIGSPTRSRGLIASMAPAHCQTGPPCGVLPADRLR